MGSSLTHKDVKEVNPACGAVRGTVRGAAGFVVGIVVGIAQSAIRSSNENPYLATH